MTSVENLFSNFNDLSKPKTILDTPSDYKKNTEPDMLKTSLQQGSKFKKLQNKIIKKTKPLNNLENPYDTTNLKEGFQGLPNLPKLDLSKNGLTRQSTNIIDETDYSSQQGNIDQLRQEYNATLKEYQDLTAKLQGATANFFDRVSPNNPYLNKTVVFTTGHVCYVTNQGVVKYIGTMEIWRSANIPQEVQVNLGIPWQDSYSTPGTPIPTKPPLISGTFVQLGQSFGNEGANVFVNKMVSNPKFKWVGCYNDKPQATKIEFVPLMNSSNNVNGFISRASSIYTNNNEFSGPWCAFDRNNQTFWHSEVSSSTNYNGSTGEYTGVNGWDFKDTNGSMTRAAGEWLWIECPQGQVLIDYGLQGRQNCCGNPNGRTPNSWVIIGGVYNEAYEVIDKQINQSQSYEGKHYSVNNPKKYNHFIFVTTNCGHPGNRDGNRYCVQIATWNLFTSSDYSFTDADRAMIWNPSLVGYTDFATCQKYAAENGFQYFSQQDGRDDGTSACLVSNDLARSQMYGEAFKYNGVPLWDSKTTGQTGVSAIVTNTGSLSIINSAGAYIYSTPNSEAQPGNYLGCYWDQGNRAMPLVNNGQQAYNYETCQTTANTNYGGGIFGYFGLQNSSNGENAQCGISNDLNQTTRYGPANNCTKLPNGRWSGGPWSNAVYHTVEPGSWYFLVLQDDGNMCVYRGSWPGNNQGAIWCSMTNGRQQQPNKNFTAAKGKYGRNWIAVGDTLAPGEFIGSNDGSIYLIYQTDGNLVLYTSTNASACYPNKNQTTVGGGWVNAIYEVSPGGTKADGGKIGYINENSELREYASDNVEFKNEYTTVKDFDSPGFDIPGAMYGGASIDQCKSTCNGLKDCFGFAFDNRYNNCWPKTSGMYPYGGVLRNLPGLDTYVREKKPINRPFGISDIIKNIDTVLFRNYMKGSGNDQYHGLTKATELEKQQVAALQGKLDTLSSRIAQLSNKFSSGSSSAQLQSKTNTGGLGDYLSDLKSTNEKIQTSNSSMTRILNDSDIVVLQKNYSYLFWSILATGTVLVTMNIAKKQ